MNIDRLAILRAHRALMQGPGRTDGYAVATVDTEVPRVRGGNRELVFRDQPAGTASDASATADTQALI